MYLSSNYSTLLSVFRKLYRGMKQTILIYLGFLLSITAAFNRGFGELGIATIIGGSLAGETRVLTTSIALDLNRGFFDIAMAYGVILMAIVIALALTVSLIERAKNQDVSWRSLSLWRWYGRKLQT